MLKKQKYAYYNLLFKGQEKKKWTLKTNKKKIKKNSIIKNFIVSNFIDNIEGFLKNSE